MVCSTVSKAKQTQVIKLVFMDWKTSSVNYSSKSKGFLSKAKLLEWERLIISGYLLTYLGPQFFLEHRPSTISFLIHLALSSASLPRVSRGAPCNSWSSPERSLLHCPPGCFLNVRLIHLHLHRVICIWVASWLAYFQRSLFVTIYVPGLYIAGGTWDAGWEGGTERGGEGGGSCFRHENYKKVFMP